jgi:glycerophosphoryl diester phosphodiesterase
MGWIRRALLVILLGMLGTAALHMSKAPAAMSDTGPVSERPDTVRTPAGLDVQGHRGARGRRPENTWPAFQYALEQGVSTLEMDVVISADGQVVVSHEPWMNAEICTAPDGTPVSKDKAQQHNLYRMTYEEIAAYDCGQRQHPSFPKQMPESAPKPLLRDVIARAEAFVRDTGRDAVFYNIETKSRLAWEGRFHPPPDVFAQHLIDVIEAAGVSPRTTVQSFDLRTLRYTRDAAPGLRLALLVAQEGDAGLAENLTTLGFVPHIYSPNYQLVDAALVNTAHTRGMQVIPWTVNNRNAMRRLVNMGVDGFITDYPDRGMRLRSE